MKTNLQRYFARYSAQCIAVIDAVEDENAIKVFVDRKQERVKRNSGYIMFEELQCSQKGVELRIGFHLLGE